MCIDNLISISLENELFWVRSLQAMTIFYQWNLAFGRLTDGKGYWRESGRFDTVTRRALRLSAGPRRCARQHRSGQKRSLASQMGANAKMAGAACDAFWHPVAHRRPLNQRIVH